MNSFMVQVNGLGSCLPLPPCNYVGPCITTDTNGVTRSPGQVVLGNDQGMCITVLLGWGQAQDIVWNMSAQIIGKHGTFTVLV